MSYDRQDMVWEKNPLWIRRYLALKPAMEKLCDEVALTVSEVLDGAGVDLAAVAKRVKGLDSFCEKALRKKYSDPLDEMTDLAGVRIVYLYKSDLKIIEAEIEKTFDIVEKVDKMDGADDQFGYSAIHYLLRIPNDMSGPRYDAVRGIMCELQVRTVLQDAWAMVAHHLSYKKESDVPKVLRRKLNALSGLFETGDDQFDRLRKERLEYKAAVEKELEREPLEASREELNIDNFMVYLRKAFPDREASTRGAVAGFLDEIEAVGYETIGEVDAVVKAARRALLEYEKAYPPTDDDSAPIRFADIGCMRTAFAIADVDYRALVYGTHPEQYRPFEEMLEPNK